MKKIYKKPCSFANYKGGLMDLLLNKIYEGSALNVLNELPENSVNMCVTSPPYWGLRDYQTNPAKWNDGWSGELGAEAEAKDYINFIFN